MKGDPLALTYDDSLHKSDTIKPIRLELSKEEADARFPHRHERKEKVKLGEASQTNTVIPEFETEAAEDARKSAETENAAKRKAELARYAELLNQYLPEDLDESIRDRKKRWKWETMEDIRRPWRTLDNRGIQRNADNRVLYDPVTMIRLVSYSARGNVSLPSIFILLFICLLSFCFYLFIYLFYP